MRAFAIAGAILLSVGSTAGLAQTAPPAPAPQTQPASPSEGQQAAQEFHHAGGSIADAARSTWEGLRHGWEASKEGARAGWKAATQGGGESHPTH